jgi:predicted porin
LIVILASSTAFADDNVSKVPPISSEKNQSQHSTCNGLDDFVSTDCSLTWNGITLYGAFDGGITWLAHGAPWNGTSAVGADYIIQKYSNRSQWSPAPNGLTNSFIGLKGKEPLRDGWDFVFDLEAGFDPYSLHLSNGPHSVIQNAGVPLSLQDAYADSSRAGQFYNGVGYLGVSSPYGTFTVFRQNSLTLDAVTSYDPLGASYAFSPIGWQGTTCGAGNTENCRFSTSVKYRVDVGSFRIGSLWQFGGYGLDNGSTGAYQVQLGGDIANLANGTLSLDAIGSYVENAVALSAAGNVLPGLLPQIATATLSNNSSVMLVGKYRSGPLTLFAGYEYIQYMRPSRSYAPGTGFVDIAGDFICSGCAAINGTNISTTSFDAGNRPLHVMWAGLKYAYSEQLDLMGGYYHYDQPAYGMPASCINPAASATCHGTFDAISVAADWRFAKKFDAYGGIMFSEVNGGLANGYLNRSTIDPTVGVRFRF